MGIEIPSDMENDEAERPTAVSIRRGEPVRRKPNAFACTTNSEHDIDRSEDTSASDIDGKQGVDTSI